MQTREIKFNHRIIKFVYQSEADLSVIDEIFIDKMYRSLESIIPSLKNPILDIGAHLGCFSIYASILNPQIKIIALEPEPNNFELLKQNLKLNHCGDVMAVQKALIACHPEPVVIPAKAGIQKINLDPCFRRDDKHVTLYLNQDSHNHSTFYETENSIEVPATTLENLILKNKLEKIGLLKMDIEGAEFEIIKNMDQKIWTKIQYIALEYHEFEGNKRVDLENILRQNGFSVEHFPNHFDKRFGLLICRNKKIG